MVDVKWIKICTNVFGDEKIMLIDGLPESDGIIVIWFKLLCLAGKQNNGGVFMLNDRIAYTDEMLATIFRRPLNVVRLALQTFENYGMIEIVNNTITIPNWEKHQNLDKLEQAKEKNRARVAAFREKQKQLVPACNDYCNVTVTPCNAVEIEQDKEIEKEIKKDIRHKYGEYKNVLLSDADFETLKKEFPNDFNERIEKLSCYMKSTGKPYKDHLATIRNWAKKDNDKVVKKSTFANFTERETVYGDSIFVDTSKLEI